MKKIVLLVTVVLCTLTSCASFNPLDLLKPDAGVDVTAQVGKTNQQEKNTLKVENQTGDKITQDADVIENTEETTYTANKIEQITQNIPIEYLLIMVALAGWAVPDPTKCYKGVKVIIVDIYEGVKFPIKELASFILKFLGKDL